MSYYTDQGFDALDHFIVQFRNAIDAEQWDEADLYLAALAESAIDLRPRIPKPPGSSRSTPFSGNDIFG